MPTEQKPIAQKVIFAIPRTGGQPRILKTTPAKFCYCCKVWLGGKTIHNHLLDKKRYRGEFVCQTVPCCPWCDSMIRDYVRSSLTEREAIIATKRRVRNQTMPKFILERITNADLGVEK